MPQLRLCPLSPCPLPTGRALRAGFPAFTFTPRFDPQSVHGCAASPPTRAFPFLAAPETTTVHTAGAPARPAPSLTGGTACSAGHTVTEDVQSGVRALTPSDFSQGPRGARGGHAGRGAYFLAVEGADGVHPLQQQPHALAPRHLGSARPRVRLRTAGGVLAALECGRRLLQTPRVP